MVALETWLVMEYCNHGTLSYAIERGKFDAGFINHGRRSNRPYIPSIRYFIQGFEPVGTRTLECCQLTSL